MTLAVAADDVFCLYAVPAGATVAALRGLTLRVPEGERLVVHGPNGSGKTTLLRVLTGEVAPSAGSVLVGGVELAGAAARRLAALRRDVLGLVDQHSGRTLRPELDVLGNVALHLRLAGRDAEDARGAARDLLAALGLDTLGTRRVQTLSGGEAQRVAVCAAVAHRPRVILADEPSGELDSLAAGAVYDLLAAAAAHADATLLLVTHDAAAARIADRVVRIRDGRLSEQWHPDVASPGTADDEALVVDSRGWVRLPERARRHLRIVEEVTARETDGGLVLTPGRAHADDRAAAPPATVPARVAGPVSQPLAGATGLRLRLGDRTLFDGLDLTIDGAGVTIVSGRSGAGKSTLLRLLLGLADPDEGTVTLGGSALAGLDRAARAATRRQVVAVSAQAGSLAETLDAYENVSLARVARGLAGDTAIEHAVIDALGLGAVARRPARLLSGGERQRVALARCLAVQRPLVILDEPTSQQDEAHAELVAAVLRGAADAGTALVCATHDPLLVAVADHMVVLT